MKKRVVQYDPEDEDVELPPEVLQSAAEGRAYLQSEQYQKDLVLAEEWESRLPMLPEDDEVEAVFLQK